MTDPLAEGITWPQDDLSMAERAQLMVQQTEGRLEFNWHIPATAAAIELVLLGRIGKVAHRSFFNGSSPWKLVVARAEPTGNPVLDAALQVLTSREKPWRTDKYLMKIGGVVATAVQQELTRRGMVSITREFTPPNGYLVIEDERAIAGARHPVARARSLPEIVTDPRLGGIVDAMRNSGDLYSGELGLHPRIRWEWYPPEHRDLVEALLVGEYLNTAVQ